MGIPKVSIIVPVYNCKPYISKCLDSVMAQTLTEIEIIAVNNGSTDGSGEILKRYSERDHRICLITQENQGPRGSRNAGLQAAAGKYIAFVDADDHVEPDYCRMLYEAAETSGSDLVICDYYMDYGTRRSGPVLSLKTETVDAADSGLDRLYLQCFARSPEVWNKLYRHDWLKHTRVRFEVQHGEDLLFHLRLLPSIRRISMTDRPLYHYVQRSDSLMHGKNRTMQDSVNILESFLNSCDDCFRENKMLLYVTFSCLFTGFMFSNFCVGQPVEYFHQQISLLRQADFFGDFCTVISQTNDLNILYKEKAMTKRFYRIQKLLFGFCARGRDRVAGRFMWLCAKLIVLKKRK